MNLSLWDRLRDWVFLLLLLSISLGTLLTYNEPAVRGLRASALELTARIERGLSWAGNYVRALDENNRLRTANIQLSSEVARLREAQRQNEELQQLLGLRAELTPPMLAARIIGKDVARQPLTSFMLDVGRADGVADNMAVIDGRGILGKVTLVSEHYAKVMSYVNPDFNVPARIERLGVDGNVRWNSETPDVLVMQYVPKTNSVVAGDRVVTSGFSQIFHSGYPIGVVDSVSTLPGRGDLQIFLRPTATLNDAEHAFVVLQAPDPERIQLNDTVTP